MAVIKNFELDNGELVAVEVDSGEEVLVETSPASDLIAFELEDGTAVYFET